MTVAELREYLGQFNQDATVKVLVKAYYGPDLCGNYGNLLKTRHVKALDDEDESTEPMDAKAVFIGATH
jgi:hypothetical protein